MIFHLIISDETVYLLTIYDKSEKESLDEAELKNVTSADYRFRKLMSFK